MGIKPRIAAHLPLDLISDILVQLPVKSLVRFKSVSQQWRDQISSPEFVKLHLRRSLATNSGGSLIFYTSHSLYSCNFYDYPDHHVMEIHNPVRKTFEVIGSCNGLLCFEFYGFQIALYNPATRAYKDLPSLSRVRDFKPYSYSIWSEFAYDCMGDDYKVFSNASYYGTPPTCNRIREETHLYSLKTNTWEIMQNPAWDLRGRNGHSVVTNNCLHWVTFKGDCSLVIWCFNLSTRGYHHMPFPHDRDLDLFSGQLAVLRGHLHILTRSFHSFHSFDIWVMKEYGMFESWTRLFHHAGEEKLTSLTRPRIYWLPCAYSKDGQKILVGAEGEFVCCDLKCQAIDMVDIPGLPIYDLIIPQPNFDMDRFTAEPWVESLVPLGNY